MSWRFRKLPLLVSPTLGGIKSYKDSDWVSECLLLNANSTIFRLYQVWLYFQEWASEWWLLNAKAEIFQSYYGENKLIFNEKMMRYALSQTGTISWIFIVLAHRNNSTREGNYCLVNEINHPAKHTQTKI